MNKALKALVLLALLIASNVSYAGFFGYDEETITTTVPYSVNGSVKEDVPVSGVLWTPDEKFKKPYPLLVWNHGASATYILGGVESKYFKPFLERGYAVLFVLRKGYKRQGTSQLNPVRSFNRIACNDFNGLQANLESNILDVRTVLQKVESTKKGELDFEKITIAGHSRGGILPFALTAEGMPGVVKVLNFSGVWNGNGCDNVFTPVRFEEWGQKIKVPVISFYGDRDSETTLPNIQSRMQILEKGENVKSYILPGAGHLLFYENQSYWESILFPR